MKSNSLFRIAILKLHFPKTNKVLVMHFPIFNEKSQIKSVNKCTFY